MSSDVRDILSIEDTGIKKQNLLDKDALLNSTEKKTKKQENQKRPRNIPRELWGLKDTFGGDFPSILPAAEIQIYKQPKAQITGKVRSWLWTEFTNSARSDNLLLRHWKRADLKEKEQDYYFAQFNKKPVLPRYTNQEYDDLLDIEEWSREETDYLMDLVDKYDMRFIIIQDRWDRDRFNIPRSVEDIKERYYMILNALNTARSDSKVTTDPRYGPGSQWVLDTDCLVFHADHEKRRKQQLDKLLSRTPQQIQEEEELSKALHRIEILKRERQKKTMDLQKLLSQADFAIRSTGTLDNNFNFDGGSSGNLSHGPGNSHQLASRGSSGNYSHQLHNSSQNQHSHHQSTGHLQHQTSSASISGGGSNNASLPSSLGLLSVPSRKKSQLTGANILQTVAGNVVWEGLKFPDMSKNNGVHLRSAEMKLPASIGIKKTRFIDGMLNYFNIDAVPIPTEEVVELFNNLRGDILLIQELYATLSHLEYELCSYREKYKKLIDSDIQIDPNKSVPTCLVTPHIPFASNPSLQLGPGLQAAIKCAEVKHAANKAAGSTPVITPFNPAPGPLPSASTTLSTSQSAASSAITGDGHGLRKRKYHGDMDLPLAGTSGTSLGNVSLDYLSTDKKSGEGSSRNKKYRSSNSVGSNHSNSSSSYTGHQHQSHHKKSSGGSGFR